VAIDALQEATESRHVPIAADSTVSLDLHATRHRGSHSQTTAEMVDALLQGCRLEVNSDLDAPPVDVGDGWFHAVLRPALDPTDRKQFGGCLRDWSVGGLLVDVVRFGPDDGHAH
jgi:hypothetical protein